jgi:hypothetical protein
MVDTLSHSAQRTQFSLNQLPPKLASLARKVWRVLRRFEFWPLVDNHELQDIYPVIQP